MAGRDLRDAPAGDSTGASASLGFSREEVEAQLGRILESPEFHATERLRRFLTFVVQETLDGRGGRLKGPRIARQVFDRGEDFDPTTDPIVRIEAGRLRRSMERYYLVAGTADPIWIDIPKGRYVPRFSTEPAGRQGGPAGRGSESQPLPLPEGPTLGVLPFRRLPADPAREAFPTGLVEEIVTELDRYHHFVAVHRPRFGPSKGPAKPEPAIGPHTSVRFLLDGTVRGDESVVKVSCHLTDTTTNRQLWAGSHRADLSAATVLEIQEEIARDIVAVIADVYGVIPQQLAHECRDRPPESLDTYDALLSFHDFSLLQTEEATERALTALQKVAEEEPDCGAAWSALASILAQTYAAGEAGIESPLALATEYARRGAALDPGDPLTRTAMAFVHLLRDEDGPFLDEVEAVLELNPGSPYFSGTIGCLLAHFGEYERGRALLEGAMVLNPVHPKWFHHGTFLCHFQAGDYEAAYREAEKVGHQVWYWDEAVRAAVLGKLGHAKEAEAAAHEVLALRPDFEERIPVLLARTIKPASLRGDLMDGLRRAGLRIDG